MLDAVRGYLQLASGLTEVTVTKGREAAAALLSSGLALDKVTDVPGKDSAVDAAKGAASQVQVLADDLLEQSKQNRELLTGLVRTEVDRAAGRLGFVREEELAAVRRHVSRLESQLVEIRAELGSGAGAASAAAAPPKAKPAKKKVPVATAAAPDVTDASTAAAGSDVDPEA